MTSIEYGTITSTTTGASASTPFDYYYSSGELTTNIPWGDTATTAPTVTWASCEPAWTTVDAASTAAHMHHQTAESDIYYDAYGGHHRVWHDQGTAIDHEAMIRDLNRRVHEQMRVDHGSYHRNGPQTAMQIRMQQEQFRAQLEQDRFYFEQSCIPIPSPEDSGAEKKALKLLGRIIAAKDLEVYKQTGRLFVKGRDGDYLVRNGRTMQKIEGNKLIDLCVHIDHRFKCPPTDNVIGLKFLLEDDDGKIVRLANKLGENKLDKMPRAACM